MRRQPHVEFELEDKDGTLYPFEGPTRHLTGISGIAMPPVKHWDTRSPFQHGESHWGYALQPRLVTFGIQTVGCDRNDLWERRQKNMDMLSPLRSPHKLRFHREDEHRFELHEGWYQGGYELAESDQDDPFASTGPARLKFNEPAWKWVTVPLEAGQTRDNEGRVCALTVTFTTVNHLVLPFSGPFLLGTTTGTADVSANNAGSWEVKPVITITGPCSDWTLTNNDTDHQISWDGRLIDDGETITISVPDRTAVDDDGVSVLEYLSGDYATFALEPGDNDIEFWTADIEDGLYPNWPTIQMCFFVEVVGI